MWKKILIAMLPQLIDLGLDYLIIAAEVLAKKTDTTIDDEWVARFKHYRAELVDTAKQEMKKKS